MKLLEMQCYQALLGDSLGEEPVVWYLKIA